LRGHFFPRTKDVEDVAALSPPKRFDKGTMTTGHEKTNDDCRSRARIVLTMLRKLYAGDSCNMHEL